MRAGFNAYDIIPSDPLKHQHNYTIFSQLGMVESQPTSEDEQLSSLCVWLVLNFSIFLTESIYFFNELLSSFFNQAKDHKLFLFVPMHMTIILMDNKL